jgi:predicted Holliday junction resolvase-like endonuclease
LATDPLQLVTGIAIGLVLSCLYLAYWKLRYTAAIREEAVQRSLAVTTGKVFEQLTPYLPNFPYNPKDVRFLGSPVDLVVFDGLDQGTLERIVFVEIKTGSAALSRRERCIREAIQAGDVEWVELRVTLPLASGAA